ncbi:MAG: DNA-formamidopyrimidine glycosylase family protein [Acidimicrobiales bacterium]
MPEGDSIHHLADRLRPALAGQPLVRLELHRASALAHRPRPGTLVADVEAVGKHLLIRFADGAILRTHLRMTGSWHLYRPGERWRQPAHRMRALVEVPDAIAVCFSAPVVALEHDATGGPALAHLGPDLTQPDPDIDACLARLAARADAEPGAEVGDLLLDQRIACGVGNVFKSEVLWGCGVDPFARVADVDVDTRRRLLVMAAKLLRRNASRRGRRVTHGAGHAVYGHSRQPCPRCGTPIRARGQGWEPRITYWCPACQQSR